MTKELFVSSTPHETKVGLVEDDQLAEVYLERENEYTLAGSIYKGRVTRVLPGMQSAFVDIGLERDAFLYVSDFMELQNEDDDLDEVPINNNVPDTREKPQERVSREPEQHSSQGETNGRPAAVSQTTAPIRENSRDDRGGWRGRRRRGRRDQPSRPVQAEPRPEREEFGPPPGYQPILLPGESISKYRDRSPASGSQREQRFSSAAATSEDSFEKAHGEFSEQFPQDEPLFALSANTEESSQAKTSGVEGRGFEEDQNSVSEEDSTPSIQREDPPGRTFQSEFGSNEWERKQKQEHEHNVAAVFGQDENAESDDKHSEDSGFASRDQSREALITAASGMMEEEEIDEEEAALSAYVDSVDEEGGFEEFEEETHAAGDHAESAHPHLIAASGEDTAVPFSSEPISGENAEIEQAEEEVDEVAAQEAELEQAQAEAEALLDAEVQGNGTTEVRAEVRAPAATAAYTQRAARPGFDRDRSRRGGFRRSSGGRGRFRRQEPQNLPQITDLLKEGQEILVQIAKEPIGKKGARITSHIALPGRFLVYMPTVNHTGVSRKIASEEERQRLKRIIQSERENGHGGFIVRTAAQGADENELRADIRFLKGLWNEIRGRADNGKSPALIYHDLNVVERILRDQVTSDFSAIWVDTEQEYERILRFANRFQPGIVRRVKLYTKETPLFEQFGLKEEIDKALKSKVWLKSGGYIVINQTEALVAIDVNTGKYVGKTARLEDTIVKTNVDAIKEIVRQIRLRDLGGIIIIDFIDMDERRNRQKVMQALEEALRSDRAPSKVLQFNDFGLVAITRKRVKQSLERTIGSPCPYCEATGFVKNVNTVCNEIYIEMRKLAKELDHSDVMLRVNPEVAKALKTNNGRWLNELEELTKKTVIVKSDASLHQEKFDIN
ncbi:MAG TPA: Rne/Rng family ribonuclease [Terriglobales bacterium]|jgi:ribonuclease G|nr:Rne/Rng family ribonuclease [Terriglobales bacterium]